MKARSSGYRGKINSRQRLKDQCHVDDITGCWEWRGGRRLGIGCVCVYLDNGERQKMRPNAAAAYFTHGSYVPYMQAVPTGCCTNRDCANPAHWRYGTRAEHGEYRAKTGMLKNRPGIIAANKVTHAKARKLKPEQVELIRTSGLSLRQLEIATGVSRATVLRARRYETYVDRPITGTSVFSFRP